MFTIPKLTYKEINGMLDANKREYKAQEKAQKKASAKSKSKGRYR